MKKTMILFTCIAVICWNSGAMDIRKMAIPNELQFNDFKLRDNSITIKEFYAKVFNASIGGDVSITWTRYAKGGSGIEEARTEEVNFKLAAFMVLGRYCKNPNDIKLKDTRKFACAFAPLLYWQKEAYYDKFTTVAKGVCTCEAHKNIDESTKFVDINCNSGTPFDLKFKMLEDPTPPPQLDEG